MQKFTLLVFSLILSQSGAVVAQERVYPQAGDISYVGIAGFDGSVVLEDNQRVPILELSHNEPQFAKSVESLEGLRIRWLGTAGFEISDDDTTILIDPFVSRPRVSSLINARTDEVAVQQYILDPLANRMDKVKAILVAHDHVDHVLDVPYIVAQWRLPSERPVIVGSRNTRSLLNSYAPHDYSQYSNYELRTYFRNIPEKYNLQGTPIFDQNTRTWQYGNLEDFSFSLSVVPFLEVGIEERGFHMSTSRASYGQQILPPEGKDFGKFKITAFAAEHPSYYGIPINIAGDIRENALAPHTGIAYKAYRNSDITYLLEYDNRIKIFFADTSKFTDEQLSRLRAEIGKVDIYVPTIAARNTLDRIADVMAALQPEYVIPQHYDDFFRPFYDMHQFRPQINMAFWEYSEFSKFLLDFYGPNNSYVSRSNQILRAKNWVAPTQRYSPELRLLKVLYYYSLNGLNASTSGGL